MDNTHEATVYRLGRWVFFADAAGAAILCAVFAVFAIFADLAGIGAGAGCGEQVRGGAKIQEEDEKDAFGERGGSA